MGTLYVVHWFYQKQKCHNFHLKLPFLQILNACLHNFICHFDEIIIISMKLKTVFVKQMHSYQEYRGADSIGV